MSKHFKEIKILHAPDIHFGHPKVEAHMVYTHMEKYMFPRLMQGDINILAITGDFFHSLLNMNSDAGVYAAMAIDRIISLAIRYKFYVRVIRGTFSHDRYQNRFFTIQDLSKTILDNKPLISVIDSISVEFFQSLNLSVMYCPDDQPYEDLTGALIDVIQSHHLDSVDVLFSHGYYDWMLPPGIPHIPNNTIYYDRIEKYVKYFCLNGHVHNSCIKDKCISGGSFERMNHGEEENKGFFVVTINKEKNKTSREFIVNEDAVPFLTINPSSFSSLENCFRSIDNTVKQLREHDDHRKIHFRIIGDNDNIASYIREAFYLVDVTTKAAITQNVYEEDISDVVCDLPIITEDNLPTMIKAGMKNTDISLSEDEIKEILNA